VDDLLPFVQDMWSAMVFVDGENLAMRVANLAKNRAVRVKQEVVYEPDVFVCPIPGRYNRRELVEKRSRRGRLRSTQPLSNRRANRVSFPL
jgi:hypothetical protein